MYQLQYPPKSRKFARKTVEMFQDLVSSKTSPPSRLTYLDDRNISSKDPTHIQGLLDRGHG